LRVYTGCRACDLKIYASQKGLKGRNKDKEEERKGKEE